MSLARGFAHRRRRLANFGLNAYRSAIGRRERRFNVGGRVDICRSEECSFAKAAPVLLGRLILRAGRRNGPVEPADLPVEGSQRQVTRRTCC